MIETLVRLLRDAGIKWRQHDGEKEFPNINDMDEMLDAIAEKLADEPVGTQLEVGGLIVRKESTGYDVYCYVGPYV